MSSDQVSDLETLSDTLQCLLASHGLTDEPEVGCAATVAATSELDAGQLTVLVENVLGELQRRGIT